MKTLDLANAKIVETQDTPPGPLVFPPWQAALCRIASIVCPTVSFSLRVYQMLTRSKSRIVHGVIASCSSPEKATALHRALVDSKQFIGIRLAVTGKVVSIDDGRLRPIDAGEVAEVAQPPARTVAEIMGPRGVEAEMAARGAYLRAEQALERSREVEITATKERVREARERAAQEEARARAEIAARMKRNAVPDDFSVYLASLRENQNDA